MKNEYPLKGTFPSALKTAIVVPGFNKNQELYTITIGPSPFYPMLVK